MMRSSTPWRPSRSLAGVRLWEWKSRLEARSRLVLISLLALMVTSCAEATPTPTSIPPTVAPTPTATVTLAPIPTLTVTSVPPGPTATARPVPTPEPSPTDPAFPTEAPTSEPTAAPTKTPAPTATPRTGEPASDRGGLWAGEENASPGHLAFRLTPGARPDVDPWRFEGAPSFPLSITCDPQREEDGWRLDGCTGGEAFLGGADVTAFVPAAGDTGLEVRIRGAGLSLLFTLTRVPRADEPIASNNVALLWHQPGEGIHSDIWAEDGVVFAPRFDGGIELLDATSGEVLGVTSTPDTLASPKVVLDVKARDGVLYAATVADGTLIFDVSEPSAPELIG